MTIEFTVPGKPVPMARPRVTMHGTYTPKRCRDHKKGVETIAKNAMHGKKPMEGAIACDIKLHFAIPKSYTQGKRMAAQYNIIRPVGRNTGDTDNHAKAIMDACTGIVWKDDSQVVSLRVEKIFDTEDFTTVDIWEAVINDEGHKTANGGAD